MLSLLYEVERKPKVSDMTYLTRYRKDLRLFRKRRSNCEVINEKEKLGSWTSDVLTCNGSIPALIDDEAYYSAYQS